ncbi:MAG: hypothetical protein QOC77_3386 [Thermoleophilaceae bacterium]|nr:hypothetical protein [Thermoleophilaceae bacterium]
MDRIEFVVADFDTPSGDPVRADPVLNGVRLVDMLNRAAGRDVVLVGLPPEHLKRCAQALHGAPEPERLQVLGCGCGDTQCDSASVEVVTAAGAVVWRHVRANRKPADAWAGIGPFQFDRADYEAAIAEL